MRALTGVQTEKFSTLDAAFALAYAQAVRNSPTVLNSRDGMTPKFCKALYKMGRRA